jgi:hypothetical protein
VTGARVSRASSYARSKRRHVHSRTRPSWCDIWAVHMADGGGARTREGLGSAFVAAREQFEHAHIRHADPARLHRRHHPLERDPIRPRRTCRRCDAADVGQAEQLQLEDCARRHMAIPSHTGTTHAHAQQQQQCYNNMFALRLGWPGASRDTLNHAESSERAAHWLTHARAHPASVACQVKSSEGAAHSPIQRASQGTLAASGPRRL